MTTSPRPRTPIDVAAERLREISLDSAEGSLLGSEEALIGQLGCSRATVRQVARLLEREGLLMVRRGINGGYFSARPDANTIEATVSAYLETLDMDPSEVTVLASALWVEAMRKAARSDPEAVARLVETFRPKLLALAGDATFDDVRRLELALQDAIFDLAQSNYIKLIFDINTAFSRRRFSAPISDDDSPEHLKFVSRWRNAKLLELDALVVGDRDLAIAAAQVSRRVWHYRLGRRYAALEGASQYHDDTARP
ncbi:MAG TPA: GntR family transcriptional regulator [Novosphingobium sp.]|nr:GntR family transcriptional regulator [Novosphingobium sp.]